MFFYKILWIVPKKKDGPDTEFMVVKVSLSYFSLGVDLCSFSLNLVVFLLSNGFSSLTT